MRARWRLARAQLVKNSARLLVKREPLIVRYQRKIKYLYKDWVLFLMEKI